MNVPSHCLENAIFFSKGDYMNFDKVSTGAKTCLEFKKIPDFYKINDEQCFATEMRLKGLKLIASELTSGSILNIRLQEEKEPYIIRNINFLIPTEADANLVSIEMFNDDIIAIRVPLRVNPCN